MQKTSLRTQFLESRRTLGVDFSLSNLLFRLEEVLGKNKSEYIGAYSAIKNEITVLSFLFSFTQSQNLHLALPKVQNREMQFYVCNKKEDLQKGAFGILEPQSSFLVYPKVLIVPALAIDKRGYRLGYGGSYYDRYLQQNPDVITIAIVEDRFLVEQLPNEPHDKKMHYVVTEKRSISFH